MKDEEKEGRENPNPKSAPHVEPMKVQCCPECSSTRLMRDYECAE